MEPSRQRTGERLEALQRLRGSTTIRYGVALVCVAVSLLLYFAIKDTSGEHVSFFLVFPAVIVASWFGGFGPGLFATVAVAAAAWFLPAPAWAPDVPAGYLSLGAFVLTGGAIAWLGGRLQRSEATQRAGEFAASARAEESDARWRAVIDSAVDGIIVIDAQGRIETFNPAAERLFGYVEQEVLGRNVAMLMPSPYRDEHDEYVARYLTTGTAKIIGIGREVPGLRKDGSTFPLHLSVGEMTVHGERKFSGILHDLSARAQIEEQLREQASLVRLGEMAAVLAHEVKNPLAGIRGAIQVVGTRVGPDDPSAPILKEIVARIDSLDEMMKDLLFFARPPELRVQPLLVTSIVSTTASLLTQDPALRDVEIVVNGSAPPVVADPNLLKVVFQNVLINSAHAMHGNGRIRVDVTAVDSACQIEIVDSGPGIPADVRPKIFVPFFTTKSRGTGLGLPTVKRLIEAHHGQVVVDCPPGGGTAVVIRLPLASSQPPVPVR